jgi:DNA repair protein RadD
MASLQQFGFMRQENEISLPPMRAWQQRTVEQIRQAIREGHRRIVVQSPTGAGKTLLAAHLFAGSIAKGKRPMFTVPDITLVEQTLKSFERVGIHDVGVIQAQHERTDWDAQVQIASVKTLIRRELPDVDLIVIDECHVQFDKLNDLLDGEKWKDKAIVGLSATPWARGMGLHWTKLIVGATIKELIAEGILCGFQGYGPDQDVDLSGVRIVKGEFDEGQSSAIMRDARIVADVVEQWRKHGSVERIFMFCVDRAHAREQQAKFEAAGIPFGYIDGTMDHKLEREPVFKAFREGKITGIASVGCLSRGVDEDVHCIIDVAPTNSEMVFVQKIGRGLRNPNGNKTLLILDHAGNASRLGMVTDIHHDTLDSRTPGDRSKASSGNTGKKPHKCPSCNAIIPYGRAKCPICGAVLKVASHTTHAPGELSEYSSGQTREEKRAKFEDKQAWYSGFLGLALERNHSEGWAAHRYRAKFNEWPNGLRKEPSTPTNAVRQYDKFLRIKYIKGKQAENG